MQERRGDEEVCGPVDRSRDAIADSALVLVEDLFPPNESAEHSCGRMETLTSLCTTQAQLPIPKAKEMQKMFIARMATKAHGDGPL